jgi:Sugar-binding N-terminal domain
VTLPVHDLECLLIADDLTGACDAAVQFARHGRRTVTLLRFDQPATGVQVLAVSTESRDLEPARIPAMIQGLAERLPARDVYVILWRDLKLLFVIQQTAPKPELRGVAGFSAFHRRYD